MSQQAYVYSKKGLGNSTVQTKPIPEPKDHEILVKIESAAVNPIDWKVQAYQILVETFPTILGLDVAGTVEKVGPQVTKFKTGDKVFYQTKYTEWDRAAFQQYAVASDDFVAIKPSNVSLDEAATFPATGFTAFVGLFSETGLGIPTFTDSSALPSKTIVIVGGASSVGLYAIQFARIAGFTTIITTASPKNFELLKSLGATHVFDRSAEKPALLAQIKQAIGDEELIYSFDPVASAETQELAWSVLSDNKAGTVATTLQSYKTDSWPKKADAARINAVYGSPLAHQELAKTFYGSLNQWVGEGKLKPNQVKVFAGGLGGLEKALEAVSTASAQKIVIHPWEA